MKIAVTAVTGQLGRAVAQALVSRTSRARVVGLARSPRKVDGLDIEQRPGDYASRTQLQDALGDVDTLLLVSGNAPPDERASQHRNVIEAAQAKGVRRIVYTSVQGIDEGPAASAVVLSNRRTEADMQASGLEWVIGRNGIYIEPDVEAVNAYREAGEVANSAGEGRCGYTTRSELAAAYADMALEAHHVGQTYRLHGAPMTQAELVDHLNRSFGLELVYRPMSVQAYREDRAAALGEFMGPIISGIYEAIRAGAFDHPSDFERAAGRPHQSWMDYFAGT